MPKHTLFYNVNSPFARKCRVVMFEKGLQNEVELVESQPPHSSEALLAANPLARIPALVTESGEIYCESPVICEYLDSLSEKNPLFPADRNKRIESLRLAAIGSGIMDSAVAIVIEKRRPEDKQYDPWIKKKEQAILRSIKFIAEMPQEKLNDWNIGTINIAVASAYVDFRLPHLNWRRDHDKLSQWLDFANKKPSMLTTAPVS